jgi:uncharacterized OsmC-like protein
MAISEVTVSESGNGRFAEEIKIGAHMIYSDEPTSQGGTNRGPSPYELVMAALGACTAMTIRMYAERHELKLRRTTVRLRYFKLPAISDAGALDYFERTVGLEGDLTEEQRLRLLQISEKCPVGETLRHAATIDSRLATAASEDNATLAPLAQAAE